MTKKITCPCGCGNTFYASSANRKYFSPACGKRIAARKAKAAPKKPKASSTAKCKFCGDPISGSGRKICAAQACRDKQIARRNARQRVRSARNTAKEKAEWLKQNPIYCEMCGKRYTTKDDRRFPVCHRAECRAWWSVEREIRKKMRSATWKKPNRQKPIRWDDSYGSFASRPDDFTQADYIEQLKKNKAENGRSCLTPNCDGKPVGSYYFCKKCRAENNRISDGMAYLDAW